MRTALIGAVALLGFLAASEAGAASIQYSTTDLGKGYQFLAGTDGQDYGVAGSNGVAYAFDKTPVRSIDVMQDPYHDYPYGRYAVLTMQVGSHQTGFVYDLLNSYGNSRIGYAPITEGIGSGWYLPGGVYPSPYFKSPVADLNAQGQVVGVSVTPDLSGTYAAFTGVDGKTHGIDASVADNLNSYVASISGVSLTSAVKVDDLGRIIAVGSDGHDYLLTPTALGAAATVPEPSTALMLGLAGSLVGLRSLARRTRQRKAATLEQAIPTSSKQ